MVAQRLCEVILGPVARTMGLGLGIGFGIALGAWMMAPWPVSALSDTTQIITGGQTTAPGERYLAPGTLFNTQIDFPNTGLGELGVSIPLFKGQLRSLRVNLTTESTPSGGSFILMVRKDGADTTLSCTLTQSGICSDSSRVNFLNGSLLSIKTINTLVDAGSTMFTYVIQYD